MSDERARVIYKEYLGAQPADPEREQMSAEDSKDWQDFVHLTVMHKTFPELARTIGDAMGELIHDERRRVDAELEQLRDRVSKLEQRRKR